MGKPRNFHLSDEQLTTIRNAMVKDPRPVVRKRALAILDLHLGMSVEVVAKKSEVCRGTIYLWHGHWLQRGIDGLDDEKGRGRHSKATADYIKRLEEAITQSPADLDLPFAVWTVIRLCEYLFDQTGIRLSERTMYDLLKRLDYSYKRPKYTLKHLQDPAAVAIAEATLAELKRGRQNQAKGENHPISSSLWTKPPVHSTHP